jgi:hyaluronan synthase
MTSIPLKLMESMSQYDDADDRGLTAQALLTWETVYVPTAVVYTDVPETMKKYLKQQIRWKKGYLRSNFFVSAFFWRKNPLMALIFYLEFMAAFTSPLILFSIYLYTPLVLHDYILPLTYLVGQVLVGLASGLDFKAREKSSDDWKYNPLMNIMLSLFLVWLIVPAIFTIKEKKWLTR